MPFAGFCGNGIRNLYAGTPFDLCWLCHRGHTAHCGYRVSGGERKIPVAYAPRTGEQTVRRFAELSAPQGQSGRHDPAHFCDLGSLASSVRGAIRHALLGALGGEDDGFATAFLANQLAYGIVYFLLVFLFTYFYTAITFNPEEVSKNLQQSGGLVPGIHPGENTTIFFSGVVDRITLWAAVFLGPVALLPIAVQTLTGVATLTISGNLPF